MSRVGRVLEDLSAEHAAHLAGGCETAADGTPHLLDDAWALYRATHVSAHAGESECRALENAFVSGARAAFEAVLTVVVVGDRRDEITQLSDELARGLLAHDRT